MRKVKPILFILIATLASPAAISYGAQEDENDAAKAASLFREAIKARGGDKYVKIHTLVSRGQFTPFDKGMSGLPSGFVDYIVYPDRERTDFGKGGEKYVQSNSGSSGWVYEAKQKRIRDQTEDQIKNFQQAMRHDLDNLLRLGWQEKGAKLAYLGRREAWRNNFSEAARIDFADGQSITVHFDPRTKLPMMAEYKMIEGQTTSNNQSRYFRWVEFDGVLFPTILDFYREGQQTTRASFDSISFNEKLPDKLFDKPANIKEVK